MDSDKFYYWLTNIKEPSNFERSAKNYCAYCQRVEEYYGVLEQQYQIDGFESWITEMEIPHLRFSVNGDLLNNAKSYMTALKAYGRYCEYTQHNPEISFQYEYRARKSKRILLQTDEFQDFQEWLLSRVSISSAAAYIRDCKKIGRTKLENAFYGDFWQDVVASPNEYAENKICESGIRNAQSALRKFFEFLKD